MNLKGTITSVLCAFFILLMLNGAASARVEIFDGDIEEGDGYQINNYVIDITDVFVEANTASYYVYEKNTKIETGLLDVNETAEFDFEGEGKLYLRLKSVHGGILPRATVDITLSNFDKSDVYSNKIVDGGHSKASYGIPDLKITKEIDRNTLNVGESVTVTVKATNVGNDVAKDVIFIDPKQEHFVLEATTYEETSVDEIDKGESFLVYIYELKAMEAGDFRLRPITATYKNSVGQSYESGSNTPAVSVEGAGASKANIETAMNVDSRVLERNEKISTTFILKNTGGTTAQAVRLEVQIPEGLEYVSGDEEFEVVGGKPRVYIEALQPGNDKEFGCTLRAKDMGSYTLTGKLSYEYQNGLDSENIEEIEEISVSGISVEKGKYDHLLELPVYVYVIPLLLLAGIGVHFYRKHREYKF
ncbi:MAG: BatD family protein [Methanosarcinaceae archaeon]|nr:BatD family protein [Methanosarcinaceae archaeon]